MSYKLRNILFCCSAVLLITGANAVLASVSRLPNQTTPMVSAPNTTSQQVVSVNVNSADIVALQKITGISKKKAQAIISYRDKNGSFKSFEDLLKVNCRGIHKKWLDKVSKFLTL